MTRVQWIPHKTDSECWFCGDICWWTVLEHSHPARSQPWMGYSHNVNNNELYLFLMNFIQTHFTLQQQLYLNLPSEEEQAQEQEQALDSSEKSAFHAEKKHRPCSRLSGWETSKQEKKKLNDVYGNWNSARWLCGRVRYTTWNLNTNPNWRGHSRQDNNVCVYMYCSCLTCMLLWVCVAM